MTTTRRGLGRGLGALIPTASPSGLEKPPVEPPVRLDRPSDMFFERTDDDGAAAVAAGGGHGAVPATQSAWAELASDVVIADDPAAAHAVAEQPIPDLAPVPGAVFQDIPIRDVRANPRQPRAVFDDEALDELTHSVREFGVLQPVVVRAVTGGFELVMGERRLRAAAAAGLDTIPAIIRDTADDAMLRNALLENIHRAQLNPLEEAAAYQQLLAEFGVTHDQLASRIGRSRSQVTNTVRLMNLPVPVQRRVAAGVLSAGHARALLSLDDADAQDDLATRIVAEGLSVRATEEFVATARDGAGAQLPRRRPSRRGGIAPGVGELADRLSDVFDTRVRIDVGQRKGKITIEFATLDDLDRIVEVMAPNLSPRTTAGDPISDRGDSGSHSDDG